MPSINAAVVTSFDQPPHYQQCDAPVATEPHQILVDVLAVGLHPRVRTGARGAHYTSSGKLPMVPGIDGVGRRDDGTLIYFAADDEVIGTMAERAVVDLRRSVELPADIDVTRVAAAMNPAMSSWVALRRRVPIAPGQSVLILGATGNAGTMAARSRGDSGLGGSSPPGGTPSGSQRSRRWAPTPPCNWVTIGMPRRRRLPTPLPRSAS
jgi:NADPH:quinone reductase-like Zn-dependent oxidoreductase